MSFPVVYNGVTYIIPEYGNTGWGPDVTAYLNALASGSLTRAGGLFSLLADVNFGGTYGVIAGFFKTGSANPAQFGTLRLSNTNTINWRNAANTGDLTLGTNVSNQLVFNGVPISATATWGFIDGLLSNQTDLQAALNLKADLTNPTFTGTGYLYGNTGGISTFSTTIPTTALSGTIVLTTQVAGILPIANGGTGQATAATAFDALSPLNTKGDIVVYAGGTNVRIPVSGTDGLVLTADSTSVYGVSYQAPGVVPVVNSQGQAPYYVPAGQTYICDVNKQVLFTMAITIDGYLQVDGYLVEVN